MVKIIQENHFHLTQITLQNNHLIIRIIEDDPQTKEIHEISYKTDIVDQTVEIISIEITIQNQIQTDLNFRFIPVPIQVLEIDNIQMIDLESLHIIEIEIIPTIGIEIMQLIEIIKIKTVDHSYSNNRSNYQRSKYNNYQKDHASIHRREI